MGFQPHFGAIWAEIGPKNALKSNFEANFRSETGEIVITSYTVTVHTGYTQIYVKPGCLWPKFGLKTLKMAKIDQKLVR